MRLNLKAFALTCGIVWGLAVWFATWWLLVFGFQGTVISNLDHFYFGYSYDWIGGVIGGIWGFVDGAVCGLLFAWLYNRLAGV